MPLTAGTRLGPYTIEAPLGAGGMGEVYKATDTRLGRSVAIKALHDLFAQHPERVARFEREAQILASLNHPNIAAIHGLEEVSGAKFLVLEFVEGRTLAEAIHGRPMPCPEAVAIARQIADALTVAHERGIIHRDLKPGNVMLTAEGQVKVLDFGLGKALEPDKGPDSAHSPTITMATQAGVVLGTAGYMSGTGEGPRATSATHVWRRCVLYKMLTGAGVRRASPRRSRRSCGEPDWSSLGGCADGRARLSTLLVKDRAERLGPVRS